MIKKTMEWIMASLKDNDTNFRTYLPGSIIIRRDYVRGNYQAVLNDWVINTIMDQCYCVFLEHLTPGQEYFPDLIDKKINFY
jgi:hypothetical protein